MKRLAHPDLSYVLEFTENKVNTLIVENQNFFREIITDLLHQIQGEGGKFVLSENDVPLEMSKHLELITQFVPFEINKKSLLTKICTAAEKEAVNESNYAKTQELLAETEQYLDQLLFPFPCEFEYEKLNIGVLLRSVGILLQDDYENDLEKILDYMQLIRDFDREKLYVFVNLRSYYNDAAVELFMKEVISQKFMLLFLESVDRKTLPEEKKWIIDQDLCEIY